MFSDFFVEDGQSEPMAMAEFESDPTSAPELDLVFKFTLCMRDHGLHH